MASLFFLLLLSAPTSEPQGAALPQDHRLCSWTFGEGRMHPLTDCDSEAGHTCPSRVSGWSSHAEKQHQPGDASRFFTSTKFPISFSPRVPGWQSGMLWWLWCSCWRERSMTTWTMGCKLDYLHITNREAEVQRGKELIQGHTVKKNPCADTFLALR